MIHSRPADHEIATAIWDDDTGETWGEALARFDTFGPRLTAVEALAALAHDPTIDMMSFGYGDDPIDFDSIGFEELSDSINEDGAEETDAIWGPFAIWHHELLFRFGSLEEDPDAPADGKVLVAGALYDAETGEEADPQ
jgi:hypothetical protein